MPYKLLILSRPYLYFPRLISYQATNVPHFPVTGRGGITLASKWSDEPESYLSLACPDFPNYFIFTGPNATVGHGTLITSIVRTSPPARPQDVVARKKIETSQIANSPLFAPLHSPGPPTG